jgi:GlpG protein
MRVIETSLDEDLSVFSAYLWQQRVRHRIFEESGRQVLEVADNEAANPVRASYNAWRSGDLVLERRPAAAGQKASDRVQQILAVIRRYPTLVTVLAMALVIYPFSAPIAGGELTDVAAMLTIVDLRGAPGSGPSALLEGVQIWRWFTPVFLHFSVVHLLFNVAVMTDFGRRVEIARGSLRLAVVILVIGVASNLGQYLLIENPLFGGLSGVAYGLLGYVLVSQRRHPDQIAWQVHPGFAFSLLLFLVIFSTGITEPFGLYVANGAHWIGLGTGALLAFIPEGDESSASHGGKAR